MTVAVLGGGAGAFATAAHLSLNGHTVNIYEVPELSQTIAPVRASGGIHMKGQDVPNLGLPTGFGPVNVVSTDPDEVLSAAQVVWLVVPAFAQDRFAEACASSFRPDQIVVLTPGNFGGAIGFANRLSEAGLPRFPLLVEAESMLYVVRKEDPITVRVSAAKRGMGVAAFPAAATDQVMPTLRRCYPDLVRLGSTLETGLRNVNTVVHAPIMILNAGRVEADDEFLFYCDGCTPSVGNVIEAIDVERRAIGRALGLDLPSMHQIELQWYEHCGAAGSTLAATLSTNPAYSAVLAPQTLDHRMITEDVPYGLVPIEELGRLCEVATPMTTSLINLASRILDQDLRSRARSLQELGLDDLSPEDLRAYASSA
jgi:opine dehydrogenase